MSPATIGSALKSHRSNLGIDQSGAAAQIGMSRTTFSSYERDLQRPSAEVLPALAQFLNVTIEEILALYGATCIEALRPSLERFLATYETTLMTAAPVADRPAPEAPVSDDAVSNESEEVHEGQVKEPSVSIFASELSEVATPTAKEGIAISPGSGFSTPGSSQNDKPKKKKKKKGHRK